MNKNNFTRIIAIFALSLCIVGCSTLTTVLQDSGLGGLGSTSGSLSRNEIVLGLKEALKVGINNGSSTASQKDGFWGNQLIKIAMPPEAQKVESTLRQLGLGNEVDKFLLSLNRAAEDAAKKSKPIFVAAITNMTISDAVGILNGSDTAATAYLRRTSGVALFNAFFPVVDSTLQLNNATKHYSNIVNIYNKIPTVQKVDPDLKRYATNKAIDGLFLLVGEEEKKIRKDPVARVSEILRKVFGSTSSSNNATQTTTQQPSSSEPGKTTYLGGEGYLK